MRSCVRVPLSWPSSPHSPSSFLGIRIGQLLLNVGVDKLTKCGRGRNGAGCRWTTNRTFFHILHLSPICALNHRESERDEGGGGAAEDTFCVVSTPFTRGTPLRWQPNFTLLERQSVGTRLWHAHAEGAIRYFDDLFIDLVRGLAGQGALLREFTR